MKSSSIKRVLALAMTAVTAISVFSACEKKETVREIAYEETESPRFEVADIAYTGNQLAMVDKNELYESFDSLEKQTFGSKSASTNKSVGRVNMVIKNTEFEVVDSEDGKAILYRHYADETADPYFDLDIQNVITSSRYICQADFKMGVDFKMGGTLLQIIYRSSTSGNAFWSLLSFDSNGNIKCGKEVIGTLSKVYYTNVAAAVDMTNRTFEVYLNGKHVATGKIGNQELTDHRFTQVRYLQVSGENHSGSMYIDNIATYEGTFPTAAIPNEEVKHAVNEGFDETALGAYRGGALTVDTNSAELNVVQSDDGNNFLSGTLKLPQTVLSFKPSTIAETGSYVIALDMYRKSNVSVKMSIGNRDILTIAPNGNITADGEAIAINDGEKWETLSVAVSKDKYEIYSGGHVCHTVEENLMESTAVYITVSGARGDRFFIDDVKIYQSSIPFEYKGEAVQSFKLMDHTMIEKLGGASKFSLSDKYFDKNGDPLIKVNNINVGTVLSMKLADAGFEENPASYDAFRMTIYCPEAYNYYLLLILDCGKKDGQWNYYSEYIKLDERGWCTITVDFGDMTSNRNPAFKDIFQITFQNSGWNFGKTYNVQATDSALNTEVEYYIESIELIKK